MASNSFSLGRSIAVSLVDLLDFLVAALVAMKTLHYESILARAFIPGPYYLLPTLFVPHSTAFVASRHVRKGDYPARHCSKPRVKISWGSLRPMKTILVDGFSAAVHGLPGSAPIIMCTPWNNMRRLMPFMYRMPL